MSGRRFIACRRTAPFTVWHRVLPAFPDVLEAERHRQEQGADRVFAVEGRAEGRLLDLTAAEQAALEAASP